MNGRAAGSNEYVCVHVFVLVQHEIFKCARVSFYFCVSNFVF